MDVSPVQFYKRKHDNNKTWYVDSYEHQNDIGITTL